MATACGIDAARVQSRLCPDGASRCAVTGCGGIAGIGQILPTSVVRRRSVCWLSGRWCACVTRHSCMHTVHDIVFSGDITLWIVESSPDFSSEEHAFCGGQTIGRWAECSSVLPNHPGSRSWHPCNLAAQFAVLHHTHLHMHTTCCRCHSHIPQVPRACVHGVICEGDTSDAPCRLLHEWQATWRTYRADLCNRPGLASTVGVEVKPAHFAFRLSVPRWDCHAFAHGHLRYFFMRSAPLCHAWPTTSPMA